MPHIDGMDDEATGGPAGAALKALRLRSGLKLRELARRLEMAPSTYASYERTYKKRYLPVDLVRALAGVVEGLGEPPIEKDEVMALALGEAPAFDAAREPPKLAGNIRIRELDVGARGGSALGEAPLDGHGMHPILGEWQIPGDLLRAQVLATNGLSLVRVEGTSMEPEYRPGDRVLVDTTRTSPTPAGTFIIWDGMGLAIKNVEFIPRSDPPRIRVMSTNPEFGTYELPLEDGVIVARVVGKWQWR